MGPLVRIRGEAGEEALELEEFEARVRRGELAGRCPINFPPLTGEAWIRADQLELFRRLHQPRRLYFSRAFNLGRFPSMTAAFVAAELLLYAWMAWQGPIDQGALVAWGAKCRPLMEDLGQLWRLLTANLLHENGLHIAFNLFVLFNVGGALENAFRRLDYLLLLLASALGASVASVLALPQAVSVGASGIVYGTLGAAVVFGVKYRSVLPSRYRRILGEATIPTVIVFLYIGFTATGVDNWAHLGGLAAGIALSLFLKPRLLHESAPGWRDRALRLAPLGMAVVALAIGGAWLRAHPPAPQLARDDELGLELAAPRTWRRVSGAALAFDNGLSSFGRASLRASSSSLGERPSTERLVADGVSGTIGELAIAPEAPASLGGRPATRFDGSYKDDDGNLTDFRLYELQRGDRFLAFSVEWPAAYPEYRGVLERVEQSVTWTDSRELREARARALLDPSPEQLRTLGLALGRAGDGNAAALVIKQANAVGGGPDGGADAGQPER